ncbi:MAG: hypothetical protein C4331_02200 [Meiothermus sp.]
MQNKGFVLVVALAAILVLFTLVLTASLSSVSNTRNASGNLVTTQAQFAAEAGLEQGIVKVWHSIVSSGAATKTITGYSGQLAAMNLGPSNTDDPASTPKYLIPSTALPNGSSYSGTIERLADVYDNSGRLQAIRLRATSTGTNGTGNNPTVRVLQQNWQISRGYFPFDYALLTNNANCVFCHSDFRSMDAFKGVDPTIQNDGSWRVGTASTANNWERVKVGTLERLENRYFSGGGNDDTDTNIHGTLYTRGTARTLLGWTGQFQESVAPSLRSSLTPGQTTITNSNTANNSLIETNCANYSNNTACVGNQNFYTNYPCDNNKVCDNDLNTAKKDWPDGPLPSTFPLPIPEDPSTTDRKTDYNEWNKIVSASIAGNSDDYPKGTLTASMQIYSSSNTSTVTWPTSGAQSKTSSDLGQGGTLGTNNVVIDGSTTPITIDKTVFINGDVVIRGRVRGQGTIIASGNVYVEGDLTYDCGSGSTTADCDYNKAKTDKTFPSLNLISAGNTLVGDYQSRFRLSDSKIPDYTLAGNLNDPNDLEAGFEGGYSSLTSSSGYTSTPGTLPSDPNTPLSSVTQNYITTNGNTYLGANQLFKFAGCNDFWKRRPSNVSVADWARRPENLYTKFSSTGSGRKLRWFGAGADTGTAVMDGPRCTVPTLAAMETGNFNRLEMRKWAKALQQGQSYIPRFYTYKSGEGIYFLGTNEEHSRNYENYTQVDAKDSQGNYKDVSVTMEDGSRYTIKAADIAAGLAKAAKFSLSSNGGNSPWIKGKDLKNLFLDSMKSRGTPGTSSFKPRPLRYDGLLYSANAIFALSQGDGSFSACPKNKSNCDPSPTAGRWDLRGSIVAADTGILTPKGLTVYYDKRLSPAIQGEVGLSFFRSQWQVKSK